MRMRSVHSRQALATQRSQIAFARGAWTGVVMIRMPVALKTASVYLASRSLIRNSKPSVRSPKSMSVFLLYRPCGGGVGGDAGQVDAAMVVLDEEQHIKPTEKDRVDVEEVDHCDRLDLGGQELLPAVGCTPRRRVDAGGLEDLPDGGGRNLVPETREFAADSPVAPGRVVAGHLQHEPADRRAGARPSWCPPRIGPAALNQIGVPAQKGARGDDQGQLAAVRGGKLPGEGGQDRPVAPGQPSDLTCRCRMAIWWRSTRISVFLALSERGSRASQPHGRAKIR